MAADRRLAARDPFHRGGPDGRLLREDFTTEVGALVRSEDGPLPLRIRQADRVDPDRRTGAALSGLGYL
ncbi:hypothetical protein ACZ90_58600 [Streptomyces albus subsp. albus]|nr:hypothetical protein ACZ90_58600 [Streptomyces albus subsp. albus]